MCTHLQMTLPKLQMYACSIAGVEIARVRE